MSTSTNSPIHRGTKSGIVADYCRRTPRSAELAQQAVKIFPSGITHDGRYQEPHPLFVERAAGARKWDVDGHEYVDYLGGHGALLLGHNHPQVTAAVAAQLERGTHYGACHELEMEWGSLVQRLVPSAQRVRFTSSGTEATLLAMRLARAFTGRRKILRFATNFHGWQDHVAFGVGSHLDGTPTPGVLPEVAENITLVPPGDRAATAAALAEGDVAAIFLEPTGASWGQVPLAASFLGELRELTSRHDTLLVFDEVISGFRCSPGGMQAVAGVTPDMTTLAKILAGGLPGGAVAGRRELLDLLDHAAARERGFEKVGHQGTFNANPLSAAAGCAALRIVAETDVCRQANDYAERLRAALTETLAEEQVPWAVYGTFSGFHLYTNPSGAAVTTADLESGRIDYRQIKQAAAGPLASKLRLGMLLHGVDMFSWPGGPTSAVHTNDDLEWTVDALRQTVRRLRQEGDC